MERQNRLVLPLACCRKTSIYCFSFLTTQELCWLLGLETPFSQAPISIPVNEGAVGRPL